LVQKFTVKKLTFLSRVPNVRVSILGLESLQSPDVIMVKSAFSYYHWRTYQSWFLNQTVEEASF